MVNKKYTLCIIREARADENRTPITPNQVQELIKKFPNDYIFYNALGMAFMNLGQFDESVKILDKAIKLNEKNIHVLNNLGLVHGYLANYQKANEYFDRALKIKPDFLNAVKTFFL